MLECWSNGIKTNPSNCGLGISEMELDEIQARLFTSHSAASRHYSDAPLLRVLWDAIGFSLHYMSHAHMITDRWIDRSLRSAAGGARVPPSLCELRRTSRGSGGAPEP